MKQLVITQIAVISCLALSGLSGTAFADDPTDPPLANSGWTVKYNGLLVACYEGNMDACDRVVSDKDMIPDTPIHDWAATCGGRLDIVTARRVSAKMFRNGILEGTCSYLSRQE
jgi:hypothetical protein